jgi:hypothetical protein
LYRGYCLGEGDYQKYFQIFIEKKPEFVSLINSFPLLDKKHRREMLIYVEEFFKIIENPYLARRYFVDGCKK